MSKLIGAPKRAHRAVIAASSFVLLAIAGGVRAEVLDGLTANTIISHVSLSPVLIGLGDLRGPAPGFPPTVVLGPDGWTYDLDIKYLDERLLLKVTGTLSMASRTFSASGTGSLGALAITTSASGVLTDDLRVSFDALAGDIGDPAIDGVSVAFLPGFVVEVIRTVKGTTLYQKITGTGEYDEDSKPGSVPGVRGDLNGEIRSPLDRPGHFDDGFNFAYAGGTRLVTSAGAYSPAGYATSVRVVPEPEAYAMMLAGLGVLGAIRRRKQVA